MGDVDELRTERLRLRQPDDGDIEAILIACQDPDIQRYTLIPVPYTRGDAEHFVHVLAPDPMSYTWTIRTLDGTFVGVVGMHTRPVGDERVTSIGYWCAAALRGRGYLGEAVTAVLDHAFTTLRIDRVRWSALVGNVYSARLAASAGFRYTGLRAETLRDRTDDVHTAVLLAVDPRTPQPWPPEVLGTSR
ncbi:GNAT family N-acetyltransferase [Gordonia insulae]|uniref:Ribosomal N-acetyltransferase YdaF n=1 Tax=Gordonia insulae TaxID=2420509 RepID=A0A3G8JLS6_9ACTN|nr:GNAT family N-acetyltransferase [Gordonia insulae]AZG45160.1 Putative ribosomal N-acetyltransferase YdaF [Gordonia insulae]